MISLLARHSSMRLLVRRNCALVLSVRSFGAGGDDGVLIAVHELSSTLYD